MSATKMCKKLSQIRKKKVCLQRRGTDSQGMHRAPIVCLVQRPGREATCFLTQGAYSVEWKPK